MKILLEDSSTERVSQLLEDIVCRLVLEDVSTESFQKELLFVLVLVIMLENGFLLTINGLEVIDPVAQIGIHKLKDWKSTTSKDAFEAYFLLAELHNITVKVLVNFLGSTAIVNVILKELNSETYTICLPVGRYIVSPQATTVPMMFRDLKHLSLTFKNKILHPVKSRILLYHGYPSASLIGLPDELMLNILLYLPVSDIVSLSMTCKRFQYISFYEILWHELFKRDFGPVQEEKNGDWKILYKEAYLLQNEGKSYKRRAAGSMHDYMDYSDLISYIDNPMWGLL